MTFDVEVKFNGIVTVEVPDDATNPDKLAEKLALSKIMATVDNPDSPDENAYDDYSDSVPKSLRAKASMDWDDSEAMGVGGIWEVTGKVTQR